MKDFPINLIVAILSFLIFFSKFILKPETKIKYNKGP